MSNASNVTRKKKISIRLSPTLHHDIIKILLKLDNGTVWCYNVSVINSTFQDSNAKYEGYFGKGPPLDWRYGSEAMS